MGSAPELIVGILGKLDSYSFAAFVSTYKAGVVVVSLQYVYSSGGVELGMGRFVHLVITTYLRIGMSTVSYFSFSSCAVLCFHFV